MDEDFEGTGKIILEEEDHFDIFPTEPMDIRQDYQESQRQEYIENLTHYL